MHDDRQTYEKSFRIPKNSSEYLIKCQNLKFTDLAFNNSAEILESIYLGNENIYLRTDGLSQSSSSILYLLSLSAGDLLKKLDFCLQNFPISYWNMDVHCKIDEFQTLAPNLIFQKVFLHPQIVFICISMIPHLLLKT